MGDPAGCGPQITSAAWKHANENACAPFCLIADPAVMEGHCAIQIIETVSEANTVFSSALPVLPLKRPLEAKVVTGTPDPGFAPAILESIETATKLALAGEASGIVTNPISKAVLYAAGFKHPGHTEYIASLCEDARGTSTPPIMMLVGGGLRVSLATIHVPLAHVPSILTRDLLTRVARTTDTGLRRDFGIASPRIAFTGLNPHAGENGTIGSEEIEIINPVAAEMRSEGRNVADARPADTVFHEALSGQFDAIIAMTHDQGLIPVKTLDIWGGVNTTLGLPIIRTSPDHGTAYDAAKAGTCRPDSLIAALARARDMYTNRTHSHA